MKRLIFTFGMISAALCNHAVYAAAPAKCFASAAAVFAAHPDAAHVGYTSRVKGWERCWFADAFKEEAEAKAKANPAPRVAATAQTSAPRPAITTPAPRLRTTALALTSQPRTTAAAPASQPHPAAVPAGQPHITAGAPASPPVVVQFPRGIPPAVQIAVDAQELSRLLPVDETPADFDSRFSVSGYKVRK